MIITTRSRRGSESPVHPHELEEVMGGGRLHLLATRADQRHALAKVVACPALGVRAELVRAAAGRRSVLLMMLMLVLMLVRGVPANGAIRRRLVLVGGGG